MEMICGKMLKINMKSLPFQTVQTWLKSIFINVGCKENPKQEQACLELFHLTSSTNNESKKNQEDLTFLKTRIQRKWIGQRDASDELNQGIWDVNYEEENNQEIH